MIKNISQLFILLIFISNCGFKVVNNADLYNFNITNIQLSGDKKIGFILKNSLTRNKNENKEKIELKVDIEKIKNVKEKNLGNEITKYEILIKVKIDFNLISKDQNGTFTKTSKGSYSVQNQYSQTLIQEKNLINNLTEKIIEEVQENLSNLVNDL